MNRVFVILGVLLIVCFLGCDTASEMVDDVISMPITEEVAPTSLTFSVTTDVCPFSRLLVNSSL